jgi:hypothetical protein
LPLAANVERGRHRVEQPAARRCARRVDAVAEHRVEHGQRLASQIAVQVEIAEAGAELRPAQRGRPPRLAHRLRAADQRDGLERAEPLGAPIVR